MTAQQELIKPSLFKRSLPHLKIALFASVALSLAVASYVYISKQADDAAESSEPSEQEAFTKEETLQAELENMKYQLLLTQNQLTKVESNHQKTSEELKLYKRELSQYKTRFGDIKNATKAIAQQASTSKVEKVADKKPEPKPTRLAANTKAITKVVSVPKKKKSRKVISVTFTEDGSYN